MIYEDRASLSSLHALNNNQLSPQSYLRPLCVRFIAGESVEFIRGGGAGLNYTLRRCANPRRKGRMKYHARRDLKFNTTCIAYRDPSFIPNFARSKPYLFETRENRQEKKRNWNSIERKLRSKRRCFRSPSTPLECKLVVGPWPS